MKKETHIQLTTKYLLFALTIFTLIGSTAVAAHQLQPEQRTHASTTGVSTQDRNDAVAAIVKAQKANLRDRPSRSGGVVRTLNKDELLVLVNAKAIGPWYQVRDSKTDSQGWVHRNTIALLQTTDAAAASPTSTPRPRQTSPPASGRSYINVDGVRVPSPVFSDTKPAGATARFETVHTALVNIAAERARITVELQSGIRRLSIVWASNSEDRDD